MTDATHKRRPGFMLVHPRLRDPNAKDAATFLRWTKLHFRDLLNIPLDPSLGKLTKTLRFAAVDDETKYLYTCVVDDLGVLKSQPYYDVERKLNLERTRELGAEEEIVGYDKDDAMVFDIVDAKFAIFEEVESGKVQGTKSIGSYQDLPFSYTSKPGSKPSAPPAMLISLNINLPSPINSNNMARKLQASLIERLAAAAPADLDFFASLYRWAGSEAQPNEHPMIDKQDHGEWMVTLLVVAEKEGVLKGKYVSDMVEDWVDEVSEGGECQLGHRLWDGELVMS